LERPFSGSERIIGAFFVGIPVLNASSELASLKIAFSYRVQGRLDTGRGTHVKRGFHGFLEKVVPQQTAVLRGLMALLVPFQRGRMDASIDG
jgi:hypothetical protein